MYGAYVSSESLEAYENRNKAEKRRDIPPEQNFETGMQSGVPPFAGESVAEVASGSVAEGVGEIGNAEDVIDPYNDSRKMPNNVVEGKAMDMLDQGGEKGIDIEGLTQATAGTIGSDNVKQEGLIKGTVNTAVDENSPDREIAGIEDAITTAAAVAAAGNVATGEAIVKELSGSDSATAKYEAMQLIDSAKSAAEMAKTNAEHIKDGDHESQDGEQQTRIRGVINSADNIIKTAEQNLAALDAAAATKEDMDQKTADGNAENPEDELLAEDSNEEIARSIINSSPDVFNASPDTVETISRTVKEKKAANADEAPKSVVDNDSIGNNNRAANELGELKNAA